MSLPRRLPSSPPRLVTEGAQTKGVTAGYKEGQTWRTRWRGTAKGGHSTEIRDESLRNEARLGDLHGLETFQCPRKVF